MPSLNWIGKEAVVNHDKEVPFRLFKKVKSASVDEYSQNLIIHGDNLEALKALMPYYRGRIKCIYIDPPYNTGNEGWVYNDKVNSPKIKKWLGKVVGGESEDLCRHDKWLCMMYPRLNLLKQLLSEDGSIWISIDDSEISSLRLLMDEIFGADKFIACNVWQKRYSRENREAIGDVHEYILVYALNPSIFKKIRNRIPANDKQKEVYKNPNNDPKGRWRPIPMTAQEGHATPDQFYEIVTPSGKKHLPPTGRCWGISKATYEKLLSEGRIYFGKNNDSQPNIIRYLSEVEGFAPWTWWPHEDVGHTDEAKKEIHALLGKEDAFETPKPLRLIQQILRIASNPGDIILDSFAGTGTTGHAVLSINKEDGGSRRFILVEMEDKVAKEITTERIKRAIKKYEFTEGFEYCELDKPLFNEEGQIEEECSFEQLAAYIYFTETNTNLDLKTIDKPFIGEYNGTDFYLLFKEKGKNILNKMFLKKIRNNKKQKIVYADKCFVDEKILEKFRIQFKQIPYEVKVY